MDFEKLCAERYSLRKYADRPVEAEKLEKVLEGKRKRHAAIFNGSDRPLKNISFCQRPPDKDKRKNM